MLRVLITDDHAMIRVGLKQVLANTFPGIVLGEARTAEEALEAIRLQPWDLMVMDITMPGRSGLDVLKDIQLAKPNLPVLIMSMHGEDQFALRVIKAGAAGFLSKHSAPDELMAAIRRILSGGKYVSNSVSDRLLSQVGGKRSSAAPHEKLSEREFQVMCLFASGKANKEIAQSLALSVKTVSTYRARILEKMQMESTAELTRYAIKNNLVE
jgi:DNA-binding NarL/FixJ family response regulator